MCPPGLAEAREHGVGVHLMDFGSGVSASFRRLKTLNYLPAVVGKSEAKKRGCFESLYRLADSTVLEGTTSNFFVVKNGRLLTTPVAHAKKRPKKGPTVELINLYDAFGKNPKGT